MRHSSLTIAALRSLITFVHLGARQTMRDHLATAVALSLICAGSFALAGDIEDASGNGDKTQSASRADENNGTTAPIIPVSALQFRQARIVKDGPRVEITPHIVRKYAGMVPQQIKRPKANEDEVVSLSNFFDFRDERRKQGKAGIYIGVVVSDEPYTPSQPGYFGRDHFRAVRDKILELLRGAKNRDASAQGYAQRYGAEVQAIIPLKFFKGAQSINENGSRKDIRVNDIIILINDHVIPEELEEPHYFPSTLDEMEEWINHMLSRDYHLYSHDEHRQFQEIIKAEAKRKYQTE